MNTTHFEKIVAEVKTLSRSELWRLRAMLETWLSAPRTPPTEEEFEQEMVRKGVLSVPPPLTDLTAHQAWKPIEIQGKPLSETIIEERR